MLNADWIQLNCRVAPLQIKSCRLDYDKAGHVLRENKSGIPFDREYTEVLTTNIVPFHPDYKTERQPIRTSLAKYVDYVYYKQTKIAEVLSGVDNININPDTIFVRFDNKFLYGERLFERVNRFLVDNGLVFHNWTRFDVACDFNKFLDAWGHKELDPAVFIKRYINGGVRLLNKRRGKKRKGCVWFEDGSEGIELETLRLGSKYSAVNTKLYNKTKELRDHDKPYIREQWAMQEDMNLEIDVWRLEFSIVDFQTVVVDDDNFKMTLRTLDILKDENIELLWNVLQEHYFQFYKPDKNKNVSRKKKLRLFDKEDTGLKLKEISQKVETTRAHKIFIKHLLKTQQVIRDHNNELNKVAWATDYVAAWLVNKHDLKDWAASRFPGWKFENYKEAPVVNIPVIQYTLQQDETYKLEKHRFSY